MRSNALRKALLAAPILALAWTSHRVAPFADAFAGTNDVGIIATIKRARVVVGTTTTVRPLGLCPSSPTRSIGEDHRRRMRRRRVRNRPHSSLDASNASDDEANTVEGEREARISSLLALLSSAPSGESTSRGLTREILRAVRTLEDDCPTTAEETLPMTAGNWELLWTAQDVASLDDGDGGRRRRRNPFATFINPLENQSYSTRGGGDGGGGGRSNPMLPRGVQDRLESMGILRKQSSENSIKSTQAIDLKRNRIRNVVSFEANNPTPLFSSGGRSRGFITVDVTWTPNRKDERRIDVKFDKCRVTLRDSPIDLKIPLGPVGPTGWLRTTYVDDGLRITRGHKGSVFVLSRTAART